MCRLQEWSLQEEKVALARVYLNINQEKMGALEFSTAMNVVYTTHRLVFFICIS